MGRWMGWALVAALAGCGGAQSDSGTTTAAASTGPSAPASGTQFDPAAEALLAVHPDARIVEVEIEDDGTYAGMLEVEYFDAGSPRETFLDPGTLAVVAETSDGDMPSGVDAALTPEASPGLRALMAAGIFNSHDLTTVTAIRYEVVDGHLVVAIDVGGATPHTAYHSASDASLYGTSGTRDEVVQSFAPAS